LNYTVLGEAVNLAARACKAAGPGEILISEASRSRLDDRVDAEDRGARDLKGFSRPVRLWAVSGLRDEEVAGAPRTGAAEGFGRCSSPAWRCWAGPGEPGGRSETGFPRSGTWGPSTCPPTATSR
ncbi:MAG: hypothetical protein GWM92_04540, partial [Gemmatimonadetes bacterium]|nr:hypothetical protein [Gemmatimonadota bacterium]NIV82032.1 hypothetical protein [Gemmatimonadota bacterium]NIY38734.1 hypothetical protein [Gemmatimonadota bacterium]